MPRKTDGVLFELQPRPTKGEDGRPLLYAQPVIERKYNLDDIDDFCAKYRHTSKGEMQRLFYLLEEVTTMWLRKGCRVETTFGSFAPKLKLLGEHTDLCKGEHPRLSRHKEGRMWHYIVLPSM